MSAWFEPSVVIYSTPSTSRKQCEVTDDECMHEINAGVCVKCRCVVSSYESGGEWNTTGFPRAPERGSYTGIQQVFATKPNLTHFDRSTVDQVASLYDRSIKGDSKKASVFRCNKRDGIIAACLERVLREKGETRASRYFTETFGIGAKDFSNGQSMVTKVTGFTGTPQIHELVRTYAQQIKLAKKDVDLAERFAIELQPSDRAFNTSAPNSVAAALLYSFVTNNSRVRGYLGEFNVASFGATVQVSPATITNLASIADRVLEA